MNAMAVTSFERAADAVLFDDWFCHVRTAVETASGFVALAASISRDAPLDWAVAATFKCEDQLHRWLDGAAWKHLVRCAAALGFIRLSSDVVFVDGAVAPTGVAIVASDVSSGMETDFHAAHIKLTGSSDGISPATRALPSSEPGGIGKMAVAHPISDRWTTVGLVPASPQRREVLPPVRWTLTRDFFVLAQTTPFGTTVRAVDGKVAMTPRWKSAMLLLMVIYPLGMLLSRFVAPVIAGLGVGNRGCRFGLSKS